MTLAADTERSRARPEDRLDRVVPQLFGSAATPSPLADAPPLAEEGGATPPDENTADRTTARRLGALPLTIEFDAPRRLDPARAAPTVAEPRDDQLRILLSQYRSGYSPAAWAMAVGVYVVVLLLLLPWTLTPEEVTPPIPVTLVIEKPQSPPSPAPSIEKQRPAPGRLASDEMGEPSLPKPEAAAAPPLSPTETKLAAVAPPKPLVESALPKPAAAPDIAALPEIEKPGPQYKEPPKEAPKHPVVARLPPSRYSAPHAGRVPGPDATADEYLAYLKALTRQHIGLLPPGAFGGRSGETVLAIVIRDNGMISRITIERSSGDPALDEGVERVVRAAGRYPPLPQWIQQPSWEVTLTMRFPFGVEH